MHPPRSILMLPPLNESTAVEATWGYLSTVTQPLAERGFYVFPVAVIDQFLKENGLPSVLVGELLQALGRSHQDASSSVASASSRSASRRSSIRIPLVDGQLLWQGEVLGAKPSVAAAQQQETPA
jgi:hypothetical protein